MDKRVSYRVWLHPAVDKPIIEALGSASNRSAFINRALELYLERHEADEGTARQFQVHVTDREIQAFLDSVPHGQVTRILHAALWFYLGKMDGVDEYAIAEMIINRLQALGWQPGATPTTEEVPEEVEAFIDQF